MSPPSPDLPSRLAEMSSATVEALSSGVSAGCPARFSTMELLRLHLHTFSTLAMVVAVATTKSHTACVSTSDGRRHVSGLSKQRVSFLRNCTYFLTN